MNNTREIGGNYLAFVRLDGGYEARVSCVSLQECLNHITSQQRGVVSIVKTRVKTSYVRQYV